MTDENVMKLGQYVLDKLPHLASSISAQLKPNTYQILKQVSNVLEIDINDIISDVRTNHLVESRVIFTVISITIHDPEKVSNTRKNSYVVTDISILLHESPRNIRENLRKHKDWMQHSPEYRTKFMYVAKAII